MKAPTIIVAAYDRPDSLGRLLASLGRAEIADRASLVISIDGGGRTHSEVKSVAARFDWPHGKKTVVEHEPLGLVEHFYRCGDLTTEHESVVLLEDDLIVGPAFHRWASAALAHAEKDERIAGVSLATPFFDGYRHLPFEPVIDGSDGIYAQVPWYDGMAWTTKMWQRFRAHKTNEATAIHASFATLADSEWFPSAVRYLVETNRYYLLPRHAHASNTGAAGTHFDSRTDYFQVALTLRGPSEFALQPLSESLAVYDDHMELSSEALARLVPEFDTDGLTIDLLGVRDLATVVSSQILTTRRVTRAIRTWGASMHPLVANVVHDVPGDAIRLAAAIHVADTAGSEAESLATLRHHASRGRSGSDDVGARRFVDRLKRRTGRGR